MPDTSTLGIPRMLDSDPLADVAEAIRDAVDAVDDMLDVPAPAWGAAAAAAIAAGVTTSLGSFAVPALARRCTLHLALFYAPSTGGAGNLTLTPDYANARIDNPGLALRQPQVGNIAAAVAYWQLAVAAGTSTTAIGFTVTPAFQDLAAGARLRGWFA